MSSAQKSPCPRRTSHGRILGLGVIGAAVLLTASLTWAGPWFGRGHRHDPELARDHVDFMVGRALSRVDATDAQRDAIDAIVDRAFAEHAKMRGDREATRREVVEILTAETIDRSRLEALRAAKVEQMEAMSHKIVELVADAGDVLDASQRRELADWAQERFGR